MASKDKNESPYTFFYNYDEFSKTYDKNVLYAYEVNSSGTIGVSIVRTSRLTEEVFIPTDIVMHDYKTSEVIYFSEKKKITSFINSGILKGTKQTYKEYEFIYEENKEEYHGIIDLLLIKENENIIVDYKLKHTTDEAYLKQLNGYKKYIENITKKTTKTYSYDLLPKLKELENHLEEVKDYVG